MSLRERIASLLHHSPAKDTVADDECANTSKILHDLLDSETAKGRLAQLPHSRLEDKPGELSGEPAQDGGSSTVPSQPCSKEGLPVDTSVQHEGIDDTECLNKALQEYRESSWDNAEFKDLPPNVQHAVLRRAQEIKSSAARLHVA